MCNIAGYVGSRPAAPILLDMMKRQEGFAGGYFSGMATIHDGRLYHAKLTGDVARLERLTDVASFPGTIGIIHSRSNSGGGDKWAHPFTRSKNGQVTEAYIANGGLGCSKPRLPEYCQLGQRLMDEGYTMPSRDNVPNTIYPTLADGSVIHMSDIMCQLIARNLDRGHSVVDAMTEAFCEMPSEIVGLLLSLSSPEAITWSRINLPLFVGLASHGAYLSSTPLAFPEDVERFFPMAPCSSGQVYPDHFTSYPYEVAPYSVAPITPEIRQRAYDQVLLDLRSGPKPIKEIWAALIPLFDPADCCQRQILAYDVLYFIGKDYPLTIHSVPVPGAADGLTAPKFTLSIP